MSRAVTGASSSRLNPRFFIVAVLLAGISAALVYAKISSNDSGAGAGTAPGQLEVVVAKIDIKQRTTITPDMLEVKSIDERAVIDSSLTRYQTPEEVVGKVTRLPIQANQQVVASAVVDTSRPTGDAALAPVVPNGKRGFSINATQVLTAGGLILPGDYVDVVWVCCEQGLQWSGGPGAPTGKTDAIVFSKTIVQNVQVAAIAQQIIEAGPVGTGDDGENPVAAGTGEEDPAAATITLLVTPEQGHTLLMAESTGQLRASLRGPGDEAIIPAGQDYSFVSPSLVPDDILRYLQENFRTEQ